MSLTQHTIILKTKMGIGYNLYLTPSLLQQIQLEETIALQVYTHVREHEITLYGFQKQIERELFEMLLKTSGIGPKIAIAILSVLTPQEIIHAAQQGQPQYFSQVSGVGAKTAAKLCLDLQDLLKKHPLSHVEATSAVAPEQNDHLISALKNMGFTEKEIRNIQTKLPQELPFEDSLKMALSLLSKPM